MCLRRATSDSIATACVLSSRALPPPRWSPPKLRKRGTVDSYQGREAPWSELQDASDSCGAEAASDGAASAGEGLGVVPCVLLAVSAAAANADAAAAATIAAVVRRGGVTARCGVVPPTSDAAEAEAGPVDTTLAEDCARAGGGGVAVAALADEDEEIWRAKSGRWQCLGAATLAAAG